MEFTSNKTVSGRLLIGINGDLDLYSQKELRDYYSAECKGKNLDLIFDMDQVGYLDSSGVGLLIQIYQQQRSSGHELIFINMKAAVFKVIQLTRLDQVLKIYTSLEDIPRATAAEL